VRGLTDGDIGDAVAAILDERLAPHAPWPVAVAISGGGDSLALLLAASAWAKRRGRRLLALNVDHRLQAASAGWAQACADLARRAGADFQALSWNDPRPATGLSAAARDARHRLLADAVRAAGARVILLGHTADDVAEAVLMREAGATTPSPRVWGPSPAWPQGRGLFLLRPLLAIGRGDIRDWLAAKGESWIEDPANADLRFARPRARRALSGSPRPLEAAPTPDLAPLAAACSDVAGTLVIDRHRLRDADLLAAARFTAMACLCAAGATRPPRTARLDRLTDALRGKAPLIATLAGARVQADDDLVRFMREPGRDGLATVLVQPGETIVWDGRFEVTAQRALTLAPLGGRLKRLSREDQAALRVLPPAGRAALPVVVDGERALCPLWGSVDGVTVRSLPHARLLAACSAIKREPES